MDEGLLATAKKLRAHGKSKIISCDHVLIQSNIRGHSKQFSTNVEQSTMFRNKRSAKIGEYRIEIGRVHQWAWVLLLHSRTQRDNIEADR